MCSLIILDKSHWNIHQGVSSPPLNHGLARASEPGTKHDCDVLVVVQPFLHNITLKADHVTQGSTHCSNGSSCGLQVSPTLPQALDFWGSLCDRTLVGSSLR